MSIAIYALIIIALAITLLAAYPDTEVVQPVTPVEITQASSDENNNLPETQIVSDAELLELWEVTGNSIYFEMVFGQAPSTGAPKP